MHTRITTTLVTDIDLDSLAPSHSIDIEREDGVPAELAAAAVIGGLQATIDNLREQYPRVARTVDKADEDRQGGESA